MGCLSFDWSYEIISKNKLLITDSYYKGKKAIKLLRKSGCNIENHLFMNSRLDITLPESNFGDIGLIDQDAFLRHYIIGPATEKYKNHYPEVYNYQLGDKIIESNDTTSLSLFELQHRVKLPEAKRHLTKAIIFANARTPANSLDNILTYTCGHDNQILYFATLKRSPDTTILQYQPVEVRSAVASEDITIAELLNLQ